MSSSTTLESTVQALLTSGKGLLAADESFPSIEKRFKEINIPSTEENRRAYREMLFVTPDLNKFISGVILFDETIRQKIGSTSMPDYLAQLGIVPGIKVDKGTINLPHFKGEKITEGLDGLPERLAEYYKLGARFTKWRAAIEIGDQLPSHTCLESNAHALALFAVMSQEAGLVPIVEPEILMDGNHTIARCEEVTRETLNAVFEELIEHRVVSEQMILKTNMILPGEDCPEQASAKEIATATLRCFRRAVPATIPGIVFLSGGQSDKAATERLAAICAERGSAWKLTFSFGRALQEPSMKIWKGISKNVPDAQKALHDCAQNNSFALQGKYSSNS